MLITKWLPRLLIHFCIVFLFCPGYSEALQLNLYENQTLLVTYNEVIPSQTDWGQEVNHIQALVRYERSVGDEIVYQEIFSDTGEVIFSSERDFTFANIGTPFEVYDTSVPNYTNYVDPFYAELDQYNDGIGNDLFSFTFTPLSGDFIITGFEIAWHHYESAYMGGSGHYVNNIDAFSYEVINSVPEPGTLVLLLCGSPLFILFKRRGRKL